MLTAYQTTVDLLDSVISQCDTGVKLCGGSSNNLIKNGAVKKSKGEGIRFEGGKETPDDNILDGVEVSESVGTGIVLYDGLRNQILNTLIAGNNTGGDGHGGIGVLTGGTIIHGSIIQGNECYGVYADDMLSTQPVDAVNNSWGHVSGPSGVGPGSGDAVSAHVTYMPWTGFDPAGDADNDGWPNLAEIQKGTNPYDALSKPVLIKVYVGGAGSDDANLGDEAHPVKTLHEAVERVNGQAEGSYTIHLSPGIYSLTSENRDVPLVLHENTVIEGNGAELDGAGSHGTAENPWTTGLIVSPGAESVTIQGLTIKNFSQGVLIHSDGGCVTMGTATIIMSCGTGIQVVDSTKVTLDLTGTVVQECETGMRLTGGTSNVTVRNGVIYNNTGDGIRVESCNNEPLWENRFEGVEISQNGGNGIIFYDGTGHQVTNCQITGNNKLKGSLGGVAVLTGCVTIHESVIEGNECYGVYADNMLSTQPVDATNNWWGHTSGPYHAESNSGGLGDAVSDHVAFAPWIGFDAYDDSDHDGWPRLAEMQHGTDPNNGNDYPNIAEFYVGGEGADDANLGTDAYPLKTFHGAARRINGLKEGDFVVHLAAGTYSAAAEDGPISLDHDVTLLGAGTQSTVLDGAGSAEWRTGLEISMGASNVRIRDLTIRGFKKGITLVSEGGCLTLAGVLINGCTTGLEVVETRQVNIDLTDSEISGCETGAMISGATANTTIRNGFIRDNLGDGIRVDGSSETPDGNRIENVTLFGNAQSAIALLGGGNHEVTGCTMVGNNTSRKGYGAVALLSGPALVSMNRIEDNGCAGVYGDETASVGIITNLIRGNEDGIRLSFTSDVTISSNTISQNQNGIVIEGGSSPTVKYNIVWNNSVADLLGEGCASVLEYNDIGTRNLACLPFASAMPQSNISFDPRFKNPAGGDFTLQVSSPCIDRTDRTEQGVDLAGTARPKGIAWDMGAFEALNLADTDGDGLPDIWEQRIVDADPSDGFTSVEDVLPGEDYDGDGRTNLEEYLADSDPTSALSLTITEPAVGVTFTAESTITLSGTSSNATMITIKRNGLPVDDLSGALEYWSTAISLLPGQNLISVTAEGDESAVTSSITVVRDNENPIVSITVPKNQGIHETTFDSMQISGLASDDTGLAGVAWTRMASALWQMRALQEPRTGLPGRFLWLPGYRTSSP